MSKDPPSHVDPQIAEWVYKLFVAADRFHVCSYAPGCDDDYRVAASVALDIALAPTRDKETRSRFPSCLQDVTSQIEAILYRGSDGLPPLRRLTVAELDELRGALQVLVDWLLLHEHLLPGADQTKPPQGTRQKRKGGRKAAPPTKLERQILQMKASGQYTTHWDIAKALMKAGQQVTKQQVERIVDKFRKRAERQRGGQT